MNRVRQLSAAGLLGIVMIFELAAFALLSLRDESFDYKALIFAGGLIVVLLLQYIIILWISKYADRFILVIANLLAGIGMIVQYRLSYEVAFKQLVWFGIGIVAMIVCVLLMRAPKFFKTMDIPLMALSIAMLGVLLVIGTENGGAKNWIKLGGISVQPSEFVKVALVFVMANHFTKVKRTWDWLPSAIFAIIVAGLLVAERDLGAALLICGTYLIMFYTATGKVGTTLVGLGAGAAGAVASYYMFDHVKARVAIWLNPWATYSTSGYQIAQGLMAIASGGLWGLGLTKGLPKSIPAYNTDYIFAVICEDCIRNCCDSAVSGVHNPGRVDSAQRQKQVSYARSLWLHGAHNPAKLYNNSGRDKAHTAHRHNHALRKLWRQLDDSLHDAARHTRGRIHTKRRDASGRNVRSR